MQIAIVGAASAALAVAALASASTALADPEGDFLSVISGGGITWSPDETDQMVNTGYAVCQDWVSAIPLDEEMAGLVSATGWSGEQARYFIWAATSAFCPEYEYMVS